MQGPGPSAAAALQTGQRPARLRQREGGPGGGWPRTQAQDTLPRAPEAGRGSGTAFQERGARRELNEECTRKPAVPTQAPTEPTHVCGGHRGRRRRNRPSKSRGKAQPQQRAEETRRDQNAECKRELPRPSSG